MCFVQIKTLPLSLSTVCDLLYDRIINFMFHRTEHGKVNSGEGRGQGGSR